MKKSKNVLYHPRLSQNIVLLIGISLFEEKQTKPIDIIFLWNHERDKQLKTKFLKKNKVYKFSDYWSNFKIIFIH